MLAGGVSSPDGAWLAFASVGQGIALNQVIWRSVKGSLPYPGAVRRFGHTVVSDGDDDDNDEPRLRSRKPGGR